jgi:hypothetical protein
MAIGDDYFIDYVNQYVTYTGGFTNNIPDSTYTANALYSWLQDTFDEPAQMDNPVPMDAKTPTSYELLYPWFMDDPTLKSLTAGAVATNSWTKSGAAGITRLKYTGDGAPTQGGDAFTDKGVTLTGGTSTATGDILWTDNANDVIYVRNTSSAQFDDTTPETVTGTGWDIDLDSGDGVESGENLWTNMYTIGTIVDDTDLYVIQNDTKLTSWWADGHIDVVVKVKEMGTNIDSAQVTVLARQFGTLFDHFTPDLSTGGRQPVPLATAADLNNATGYKRTLCPGTFTGGPFTVGEVITGGSSGAKAILTAQVADTSVDYYLVGKDLTDFNTTAEVITGETSGAFFTKDTNPPSNQGPATWSDVTLAYGAILRDLNNGAGSRKYSIEIDCNTRVLSEVYERLKYLCRRGSTTQLGPAGSFQQDGEQYIGNVLRLNVTEGTAWAQGLLLTQNGGTGTGSTGVIVAYHDDGGTGQLILSQVRGTFSDDETTITDSATGTGNIDASGVVTVSPTKQSPFGTFAGGTFFGAPGVFVTDVNSADIQAYQLIDDLGSVQLPPNEVSIAITGLEANDRAAMFRLLGAGLEIEKDTYPNTVQSVGAGTVIISGGIDTDEPQTSYLRIVDKSDSNEREARLEHSSWTSSTFTLRAGDSGTATATDTNSGTVLEDTGAFVGFPTAGLKIGDVILNTTDNSWAVVVDAIDGNQLQTTQLADGTDNTWQSGDTWDSNLVPFATTTSDRTYVGLIDEVIDSGVAQEASNSLIYSADIPAVVRVRVKGIKPFSQETTVINTGRSVAAIRTSDDVVT